VTHIELSPDGHKVLACTALLEGYTNRAVAQIRDLSSGAVAGEPMVHTGTINFARFSPDGQLVVTASNDRTARVWEATTGAAHSPVLKREGPVVSAAFSADGRLVATGTPCWSVDAYGYVAVWDARTGQILNTNKEFGMDIGFLTFMPTADHVLVGSRTYLCNLIPTNREGSQMIVSDSWQTCNARFSADEKLLLLAGSFGKMRQPGACVFHTEEDEGGLALPTSGKDASKAPPARPFALRQASPLLLHADGAVLDAVFSPDETRVATAGTDGQVRVWDWRSGKMLLAPLHHEGAVLSVRFSPDGSMLLSASQDHTACLWDTESGSRLLPPLRHAGPLCGALFTPDGQSVVTASADGTVRVWRIKGRELEGRAILLQSPALCARFSPDGRRVLATAADGSVRFWDAATQKELDPHFQLKGRLVDASFSPSGLKVLARVSATHRWWPWAYELLELRSGASRPLAEVVGWATFAAGGARLLTFDASEHGAPEFLHYWDVETGLPWPSWPADVPPIQGGNMFRQKQSSDGGLVATFHMTDASVSSVRLWDEGAQRVLLPPLQHETELTTCDFSLDSRWLATGTAEGVVRLWDTRTKRLVFATDPRYLAPVAWMHFSPDGRKLVSTAEDGTVRAWDIPSGRLLVLVRHGATVPEAAFSPDVRSFATASLDGTARLWDADTGEPLSPPLAHGGPVHTVEFSPDGRTLLTASGDQTVRFWAVPGVQRSAGDWAALARLVGGELPEGAGMMSLREAWHRVGPRQRRPMTPGREAQPDVPLLLLALAAKAEQEKHWEEATRFLTRFIQVAPSQWHLFSRRGWARLHRQDYEGAISDFSRAIELKPEASVNWLGRYLARTSRAETSGAASDFRKSLESATGFRLLFDATSGDAPSDPSDASDWLRLTSYCAAESGPAPLGRALRCARAVAEGTQVQWVMAAFDFAQADADGRDPDIQLALALAYRNLWPEAYRSNALAAAEAAIGLAPQRPRAYAVRGELSVQEGLSATNAQLLTKAEADFKQALGLGMNSSAIHEALGDVQWRLGRWRQAAQSYQTGLERDPANPGLMDKLARLYLIGPPELRDVGQASTLAGRAVAWSPFDARFQATLGMACYRQADYANALGRLQASVLAGGKVAPPSTWFFLAMSQFRLGQNAEALKSRQLALDAQRTEKDSPEPLDPLRAEADQVLGMR
jgi:WD40 repeat protein/tetratricopeptide (TPR) repeat protein